MSNITEKGQATRNAIIALRKEDPCMKAIVIADRVGVSRERVRQLLVKLDLQTSFISAIRYCEQCQGALARTPRRLRYCSMKCYSESRQSMYVCDECGNLFKRRTKLDSTMKRRGYRFQFCDRRCLGSYAGKHYGWGKDNNRVRTMSKFRLALYRLSMKIEEVLRK